MTQQRTLHDQAGEHLSALESIIDDLKAAGACPLDGWNALLNIRDRMQGIVTGRFPDDLGRRGIRRATL
jgi:hypothetical protein